MRANIFDISDAALGKCIKDLYEPLIEQANEARAANKPFRPAISAKDIVQVFHDNNITEEASYLVDILILLYCSYGADRMMWALPEVNQWIAKYLLSSKLDVDISMIDPLMAARYINQQNEKL